MPTSIEQIEEFLDEYDLNYRSDPERNAILIGFGLDPEKTTFRDMDGEPGIQFVIQVVERGEFLAIFVPRAWSIADCPHKGAVFEALAGIQSQYKMLRFDYDPSDGELRPNVELPLEDAELTSRQFHRLLHGMLHGVPRFDAVIRHAMATGEVSFAAVLPDEPAGAPSPAIARLQRMAEEAGGLEELERLACGACDDSDATSDEPVPPPAAEPANGVEPPRPKPGIRRIWEHLFGPDGPESDEGRKAG